MTGHRTAPWSWSFSMHLKWSNGTCVYVLTPLPLLSECPRWRRSCTSDQSLGRRENQTAVRRHANTCRTPLFCQDSIFGCGRSHSTWRGSQAPSLGNRTPNHPMSEVNTMPFPLWHKRTERPNCSLGRLTVHSGENVGQCGELAASHQNPAVAVFCHGQAWLHGLPDPSSAGEPPVSSLDDLLHAQIVYTPPKKSNYNVKLLRSCQNKKKEKNEFSWNSWQHFQDVTQLVP